MNSVHFRKRLAALMLALMMLTVSARADSLKFPEGLKEIEEAAFKGDKAITKVVLPDGLTTIGADAFRNCSKLKSIRIPASVTSLGGNFIAGCPRDVLIKTTAGSAAMRYAQNFPLDYQADTTYRALLIGETYEGKGESYRPGNRKNVAAMEVCLTGYAGTPYIVTKKINPSYQGVKDAISSAFAGAREQDVSLFYYCGHGGETDDIEYRGCLCTTDYSISSGELRTWLDKVPGRKIVIIDCCFSGNHISPDSRAASAAADAFVDDFISTFAAKPRKNLMGEDYYVLTSCGDNEYSYSLGNYGIYGCAFTIALLKGCGVDIQTRKWGSRPADANGNGCITLQEAFAYALPESNALLHNHVMHCQVYPTNCHWIGILRN